MPKGGEIEKIRKRILVKKDRCLPSGMDEFP
jgi:hypothetical protein